MNDTVFPQANQSSENLTKIGEKYYLDNLKDKLEKTNNGDFLVLEVESHKYFINQDLMVALNQAKNEFPDKLFFIVQIGTLQKPAINYKRENYAWLF